MCRWMAYSGDPLPIDALLFNAQHNLIDQSMSSRSAETPTNGDGFGLGWYGRLPRPGLFHSIRPAWNDSNLRDLAEQIESPRFFAHVRATSLATVQETNCHPFRWKNWLFVHNGEIYEAEKTRRDLMSKVAPEYYNNILGSTDSELMFHLALSQGLEKDPPGALARMAAVVEQSGRENGVPEALWATIAVTDGDTTWAVRYASDGKAPTLYYSRDAEDLYAINPALRGRYGATSRIIVSEPIGKFAEMWVEVPQSSLVTVRGADLDIQPFAAAA